MITNWTAFIIQQPFEIGTWLFVTIFSVDPIQIQKRWWLPSKWWHKVLASHLLKNPLTLTMIPDLVLFVKKWSHSCFFVVWDKCTSTNNLYSQKTDLRTSRRLWTTVYSSTVMILRSEYFTNKKKTIFLHVFTILLWRCKKLIWRYQEAVDIDSAHTWQLGCGYFTLFFQIVLAIDGHVCWGTANFDYCLSFCRPRKTNLVLC